MHSHCHIFSYSIRYSFADLFLCIYWRYGSFWSRRRERSVFNGGTTHVTVTASNSCGTDICTFDINVVDTVHPTIVCPAGINTTTNSGCTATGIVLGTPVTSDNCSVASVTNNAPAAFATGTTLVTWTVTDNSGLTTSCIQSVTVADNIPPTLVPAHGTLRQITVVLQQEWSWEFL
jgi:hypothetical protein